MVQPGLKSTLYGIWTRHLQLTASFFPKTKMKHPFFGGQFCCPFIRHFPCLLGVVGHSLLSVCAVRSTQIKTYSWDNAQVLLVGNKCDMEDERVVASQRGQQLSDQLGESMKS